MPVYVFSCECGIEFEEITTVSGLANCPKCGKSSSRRVPQIPGLLVTRNDFERHNDEGNADNLHRARMGNKKHVEDNWSKVESGECEYDPGQLPEAYQPRQHLERSKKKHY